ncbi:MAG: signal peptidase I [Clostridia bacterium]|nr:signal peptidase I [Clostridia bacterium]
MQETNNKQNGGITPEENQQAESEALTAAKDKTADKDAADTKGSAKKKKISKGIKEIFEWVEMIVVSFCAVVILFTFVARPAVVVGDSMVNTLHENETLLITPLANDYKYMDIIVFQLPQNIGKEHGNAIVKRVIATEGQWVDINLSTWQVYVADSEQALAFAEPLDEPYVNYISDRSLYASVTFPLQVPEGCLFVMGDNRSESYDSRAFGCIKEEYVIGKVIIRLFPLNKFGKAG